MQNGNFFVTLGVNNPKFGVQKMVEIAGNCK